MMMIVERSTPAGVASDAVPCRNQQLENGASRRLRGLADQDAILLSPSHVGEIITSEKFELPYLDA